MMFRADLHIHTTCSDGTNTPNQVLDLAREKNLMGLSITDHDTVDAYTIQFFAHAKAVGIEVITGVEFSTRFLDFPIHVLGYNFDHKSPAIVDFCNRHVQRRVDRNLSILKKLRAHGAQIADEELYPTSESMGEIRGRVHIANLLVSAGLVNDLNSAFKEYIGDGKPCYDAGDSFTVAETIDVIHQAGGKAFIAHPHLIKKGKIVRSLLEQPFDGIECYYCKMPRDQEEPWIRAAEKNNLLISGGSDFHGANRPHTPLGCSWVDRNTFESIIR